MMYKKAIKFLTLLLAVGLFSACSSKHDNDIEDMISLTAADSDLLVLSGDVETLLKQLEIKEDDGKLEFPTYLQTVINLFGNNGVRTFTDILSNRLEGLEYEEVLFTLGNSENGLTGVFVFPVDNEKELISSISQISPNTIEGQAGNYRTLTRGGFQVLLKDNLGFIVFSQNGLPTGEEAVEVLEAKMKTAAEKPLARWKEKYLDSDKVASVIFDVEQCADIINTLNRAMGNRAIDTTTSGWNLGDYVGCSFNLEGPAIKLKSEMFDKDGKPVKSPYVGDFDTGLMKYAWSTDFAAMSIALNQLAYDELAGQLSSAIREQLKSEMGYFDPRVSENLIEQVASLPKEYLTDKGLFASFGFAENVNLANTNFDSPEAYHIVVAASLKPDKANDAFVFIANTLAELGTLTPGIDNAMARSATVTVKSNDRYDYASGEWISETYDINILLDKNTLVISNGKISQTGGANFTKDVFQNSAFAFQLIANDKNPLISQFGVKEGLDVYAFSKEYTNELVFQATNTNKKIVPALMGLLTGSF